RRSREFVGGRHGRGDRSAASLAPAGPSSAIHAEPPAARRRLSASIVALERGHQGPRRPLTGRRSPGVGNFFILGTFAVVHVCALVLRRRAPAAIARPCAPPAAGVIRSTSPSEGAAAITTKTRPPTSTRVMTMLVTDAWRIPRA